MSKLASLVFALCALYATTDAYLVSTDPLVTAKIQVQTNIRTINAQISINNRDIGIQISPIRSQQSITLKYRIAEMESVGGECAVTNLRDAQTIWPLINSLDACRLNQNYELIRAVAMPVLNQLVGDAGRAIDGCKQTADYQACATEAADGITDSAAKVTAKALEDVQKVADDSASCLAGAVGDLQNRMDALVSNWNAC